MSAADGSLGPEPIAKKIQAMHSSNYFTSHYKYLSQLNSWFKRKKKGGFSQYDREGLVERARMAVFSAFDDKEKYGGYLMSCKYKRFLELTGLANLVKKIMIDTISSRSAFYERCSQLLDISILKVDHTFRVAKGINSNGPNPIFDALYSMVNQNGQIVSQILTNTTSHQAIEEVVKSVQSSREKLGAPQTKLLYTDNCCLDREFYESCCPSLRQPIQPYPPILKETRHDLVPGFQESLPEFSLDGDGKPIYVADMSYLPTFAKLITSKLKNLEPNQRVLGVDCEWDSFGPYSGRVATLEVH